MNELALALALVTVQPLFPAWEKVTPETMTKPVPLSYVSSDTPGSVTKQFKGVPLPDNCAIREGGKVIGYRLACN